MNKQQKTFLTVLVIIGGLVVWSFGGLGKTSLSPTLSKGEGVPPPLGEVRKGLSNLQDDNDILLEHEGFSLLFDTEKLCPHWVSWELTAEETRGKVSRDGVQFMPDESIPQEYRVEMYDYNGGHYGRGHMCPAGDMKWSQRAMQDCHLMTNICPQTAELNKNWWEHLESACRQWARQEGAVQIVCGPVFSDHPKRFGKRHKVAVPEGFFKVVLSLRKGHEKGLGFYYANDDSRQPMEDAVRSIDEIEALTGFDFFSELPDEQEDRLEQMTDLSLWGRYN